MKKDVRLNPPAFDRVAPKPKKKPISKTKAYKREWQKKKVARDPEYKKINRALTVKYIKNNMRKHTESSYASFKRRIRKVRLHSLCGVALVHEKRGEIRTCNSCGKTFGTPFFQRLHDPKKSKTVRRPYCYYCRQKMNKDYYERTKDKKAEYNKQYYELNREKLKIQMRGNYERRKYGHLAEEDKPERIRKLNELRAIEWERIIQREREVKALREQGENTLG